VVNDTYARMLGYPPAELEETITGWRDRLHPDDRQAAYRAYEDYVAGRTDEYRVEFRNRTKDGRWKWILSLGAIVERDAVGRPLRMLGTHTDIDDAKAREVALQRANRALALRAETNRLVTQTDDERELLRAVCRLAVEQGGYRMAWVGLAGPEPERLVEPVAWAGTGTDYLQEIRITWGDDPAGRGPTGTAIRTGASRVARDIEAEPGYELWREAARARGFASSAAVPLLVGAKAIAALNLYAGEPDAFDTDELVLLEDLGRDVAYGLSALRARAQVRHLAARQEEAREAERARVSQELHDELGQGLTGLKLDLSWVRDRLSSADAEGRERVGETLRLLDATIDAVRRIAAELRPGVLDDLGLEAAMQWQAREFTKRSGIPVRLERGSDLPALAPARATALFRIFQEALTNVARHAQARQVTVRYGAESGFVRLEIADDGVGFDIAAPSSGGRRTLGLLGIQERARSHGGAAVVESEPGRGTTVTCAVPVDVS
jgi:PAS domain S-box-containing protein